MEHIRFGRTGLKVSRLCLGTMTFGYQCDADTSFAIMDAASEAGITFLDTADVYPLGAPPDQFGRTEEIVGQWLGARRDRFILATKCHFPTGPMPWDAGNSRKNIMRALDASLRRLGTDYVDLYQLHSWDENTPIDETLQALDDVVRSGKVRYIGCSNFLAYQLARSIGRAEVLGTAGFASVQPRYNLLFRENERELFPLCSEEGIAVIPYNPLAGGFLSGKHQRGAPTEGGRFTLGWAAGRYQERYWHSQMFAMVDELRPMAEQAGVSMATLAVQWVLANPVITSPIIGASRPDQLADSVAAANSPIDASLKAKIDELTYEFRFGDNAR
ncbi:MAG TPA: aldo/keto reductase [Ilumatobacteraceae bacterium]|nr:aldo/keto reductase [Ilumatobacteraceae bacterium]